MTEHLIARVFTHVSFHFCGVKYHTLFTLVLHEQTHIAAARLVWTAVILNCSEASGPLSNDTTHKMYSYAVYIKSFGGQKEVVE